MKTTEVHSDKVQQTTLVRDNGIVSVTSWSNGDGYDICLHDKDAVQFMSLTYDQLRLFQAAISAHDVGVGEK